MPELPELEALRRHLAPRLQGRMVTRVEISPKNGHLLRYPMEDFANEVPGRRIETVRRRGKHMIFDLQDGRHLVVNPMLGGRFQLAGEGDKRPANNVFGLHLEGHEELRYNDFRNLGRIYWVADEMEVPAFSDLGPEADTVPEMGREAFGQRFKRYRDEIKDLLRNQAFIAGIGNAYSDEILFEAKLLPLRRRASLGDAEVDALYTAIPTVLERAIEAIVANPDYDETKQNRTFMAVHAKGGQACPRCGHRISQLGTTREPLNFCRGCQT